MTDLRLAQAEGAIALPGDPEAITLPSGQAATLQDVVWNAPGPDGLTLRFRFIAPAIAEDGGTVDFATAAGDMAWLCQTYALTRLPTTGPKPAQIIISMADRAVPFGQPEPGVTQFFTAYSFSDGQCIEEQF